MNWNEIGTQLITGLIGIVITGLGVVATYLINKNIKNEELKEIATSLNELILNSVLEIQQTYVDALKDKELFDGNAQKEAVRRCLESIKANMPKRVEEWLKSNYTNIEDYLRSRIEAQIKLLKIGGA